MLVFFDIDIIVKLLEAITFIGHEESLIGTDIAIVKGIVINIPITSDGLQAFKVGRKLLSVMSILKVLVNDGFSTEVAVTVR